MPAAEAGRKASISFAPGLLATVVHRFTETANRSISLFHAIPDGKPLTLFLELL
ncbi:hypothetical protein [Mesorhizobium sp.]|uniref:hypothetical protein n=1 Tax=Mesorhizobium sp. TaxID=1871066 RepID=UPI0025D3C141|nr:hypothetical protein [Mesorhizobium sp.]